ncbi:MAG: hypothetical protein ACKOZX_15070, partial [Gammaproteobacteria bacterium]
MTTKTVAQLSRPDPRPALASTNRSMRTPRRMPLKRLVGTALAWASTLVVVATPALSAVNARMNGGMNGGMNANANGPVSTRVQVSRTGVRPALQPDDWSVIWVGSP